MICKKCGNEISDNEKFCGKCGKSIKMTENNYIKINTPIAIAAIVLLIILFIIIVVLNNSSIKEKITNKESKQSGFTNEESKTAHVIKQEPDWIIESEGKKVFNVDYTDFMKDCKKRLEELSGMSITGNANEEIYVTNEISYPKGWLIAQKNENSRYVYNQILFQEYVFGRMIGIEDYNGKVQSITYFKNSVSVPESIAEQVIEDVLINYGIYNANDKSDFETYVKSEQIRFDYALVSMGKYSQNDKIVADSFRYSGKYGYIPKEYKNTEFADYIKLTIK